MIGQLLSVLIRLLLVKDLSILKMCLLFHCQFVCFKSVCFQVLKISPGCQFISSYIQSPNAAVACPFIQRNLATAKSACKKPDTDSVFRVRVPTRDPSLGSTLSPHPKNPSGSGIKSNPSLLLLWLMLFLRSLVFS